MSQKCALIVDDSQTARALLGRMLEDHQLRVDTAGSAEDALSYLSDHRPDVIFMDHMMPGMDGFEAVRAIKDNPATATIPIMMYTSQEGNLYVGQARALGAIGVLPKQIKPVEVSAVLETLHLVPGSGEPGFDAQAAATREDFLAREARNPYDTSAGLAAFAPESGDGDGDGGTAGPVKSGAGGAAAAADQPPLPARPSDDMLELRAWLDSRLDENTRALRAELAVSMERAIERFSGREDVDEPEPEPASPPPPPRNWMNAALTLGLAGIAALFFWLQQDTQKKWRAAAEQNASLMAALESRRGVVAEQAEGLRESLTEGRQELDRRFDDVLAALEWSINRAAPYPHDAMPMGDERFQMVSGLVQHLRDIGFAGTIRLRSHVGDFCYASADDGALVLADGSVSIEQCAQIGYPDEIAQQMSAMQSVAFANFTQGLAQSADAGGPAIGIEVEPVGSSAPRIGYPPRAPGTTAGEWNRAAAANNRVDVRLVPAGGD